MRGNDEDIERLVKEYEKRFITYKEHMEEENNNIIIPEFLYFGKIQLEVTKTIDIIDELFLEYYVKADSKACLCFILEIRKCVNYHHLNPNGF